LSVPIRGAGETVSLEEARRLVDTGQARVTRAANPQLVPVTPAGVTSRGWRDDHVGGGFGSVFMPDSTTGWDHRLSRKDLRETYMKSAAVRPCVDFIVRSLSTCPWRIIAEPGVPKRDFNRAVDLFTRPAPGHSFRGVRAQYLNDLLVMDGAVIEKVLTRGGDLVEFIPRDFARFAVKWDYNGIIEEFVQVVKLSDKSEKKVRFTPDQISYSVLYPRTNSPYGTPIIETITQEVAALILASVDIAAFFNDNEIPQGILALGDVGEEGYLRAKEEFTANKGGKNNTKMYATYGPGEPPKWVPFRRPYREQEIALIVPRIERLVFRNFGVTPLDMGVSSDVNRSTAESYKELRVFNLFKPLMDLMAEKFTFDLLHEIHPGLYLELVHTAQIGDESTAVDTDIPGEGEGASMTSSGQVPRGYRATPFFGLSPGQRITAASRPDGMGMARPTRAAKPIEYSTGSDDDLLARFGGTKETAALTREARRLETVIRVFIDEANQRLEELEPSHWNQARAILGDCQDQVVSAVDAAILTAEVESLRHVMDVDPELGYSTVTHGLSRAFGRTFNKVFVIPTFDDFADENADEVDPFPRLAVLQWLKQAAAAPIRASLRDAERSARAA